jgi:hypothetical protein
MGCRRGISVLPSLDYPDDPLLMARRMAGLPA